MEAYVVGGHDAMIEQFPHVVFMYMACNGFHFVCGGSILTQSLVLTAAHCLMSCQQELDVIVFVGNAIMPQNMKAARPVSLYMVHEGFDERTYRDDVALAHTQEDLPLGRTVKRVIINRKFPSVARLQLAGWGLDDTRDGQYLETSRLQWLQQSFKLKQACKMYALSPGMMCIENDINQRPSLGDSGCGLIANFVQQIGLLSFRHRGHKTIIIYMNVSYYYDWIQRGARQLICTKV